MELELFFRRLKSILISYSLHFILGITGYIFISGPPVNFIDLLTTVGIWFIYFGLLLEIAICKLVIYHVRPILLQVVVNILLAVVIFIAFNYFSGSLDFFLGNQLTQFCIYILLSSTSPLLSQFVEKKLL